GRREHGGNISGNKQMMIRGADMLIARERQGLYPGGAARQRERLEFLLFHIRWSMVNCAKSRQQRAAWNLYRACFAWHLRLGRWRCLFGFPAISLAQLIRPAH